jgi:hypothetical protein
MSVLWIGILGVWCIVNVNWSVYAQQNQLMCLFCPGLDSAVPQVGTLAWCCGCKLNCPTVSPSCPGRFCVDLCTDWPSVCPPTPAPTMMDPPPPPPVTIAEPPPTVAPTTLEPTPAPTPVPMPPLTLPTGSTVASFSLFSTGPANSNVNSNSNVNVDTNSITNSKSNDVVDTVRHDGDGLMIGAAVGGVSAFLALLIVAFIIFKIARRRRNVGPVDTAANHSGNFGTATETAMHSARSERVTASTSYESVPSIENYQYQYGDGNLSTH